MKRKPLRAIVLAALVSGALASLGASGATPPSTPPATAASTQAAPRVATSDFTRIVAQAGPAVVNIRTEEKAASQAMPLDPGDPAYEFFRRFQNPLPRPGPRQGIGSGFIVTPDGHILTNAHVVGEAKSVRVRLTDRREFTAKVVGTDPQSDIALLKIDAGNLPVVRIGRSQDLRVGQWVVAVGSPFGFENSVTAGIVSATSRSLGSQSYVPFIQTDVAVNPGNSGGPLFDMNGNVVGVNSQIYSRTGGYMGLSFAVPIDVAMHVKDQLQKFGYVTRGRIGVTIQAMNQSLAQSFGLPRAEGALVSSVEEGSPAARAGLRPGDVILGWNGDAVDESSSLPMLVANMAPGENVPMRIWRDGAERTLSVTVGKVPGTEQLASGASPAADAGKLGLSVRPLDAGERAQIRADSGLLVENASGAAAEAGVRQGDVILAVNGEPVRSVEQLRSLVENGGKHVALLVQREDGRIFLPVEVG